MHCAVLEHVDGSGASGEPGGTKYVVTTYQHRSTKHNHTKRGNTTNHVHDRLLALHLLGGCRAYHAAANVRTGATTTSDFVFVPVRSKDRHHITYPQQLQTKS